MGWQVGAVLISLSLIRSAVTTSLSVLRATTSEPAYRSRAWQPGERRSVIVGTSELIRFDFSLESALRAQGYSGTHTMLGTPVHSLTLAPNGDMI